MRNRPGYSKPMSREFVVLVGENEELGLAESEPDDAGENFES